MTDKDLYWQDEQTPASKRYEDIYFSPDDGLLESRHVFLNGIGGPEVWQDRSHFTLLENGFGTGLNFALTCREWLTSTPPDARLTYIATEKHPLTTRDIDRALGHWPMLAPYVQEFLAHYPPQAQGFHSRDLWGGRIKLLLLLGDSATNLAQLDAKVDAFYLDGFAPAHNPDMWSEAVFRQIARLAAPKARLATFTDAGFVRRGLENVGFDMQKMTGFGKKRENLKGVFSGPDSTSGTPREKPWFHRPPPLARGSHIAIIGGGIAGLTTGLALQNNGYRVTIYEQDATPMNRASGNPAGILDPTLNKGETGGFYRSALFHALAYYQSLDPEILPIRGLTKIPADPSEQQKFTNLLEQDIYPKDFMLARADGALHFPECGVLSPPIIRENLRRKLTIKSGIKITSLTQVSADDPADAIIICAGPQTVNFPETHALPLDPIRGQITLLDAETCSNPPPDVLCGKGYLIPPFWQDGKKIIVTGASFGRNDSRTDIRPADHEENMQNARALWPDMKDTAIIGGRCALRAYSPDHLPLCGPLPDDTRYREAYASLKHGPKHMDFDTAPYQENLYILSGLGARGFMTAPLLGDIMAALISGDPLPVPDKFYHSLHPARFQIRDLIKGRR
ncbi:MAG: bifunctional tRNA (5-methylaminomethyl-2-thiouridine)(34)-methyltransferase MnmD/FAD-dependent 5-carboxymethylaminomethyl-2-thiouridine(34) oxidoreductase MnmC [Emcibacter sp.]|nr:bifunctional tRNA (5-methylaminomethyl-2-thiouridine)(34)-methyltransferase MnmD/FAD-dependent 5-carboxymethylaminomethyl-2-thiouridine(34) oxidoreductase MnmC [Emcibacter sp.]